MSDIPDDLADRSLGRRDADAVITFNVRDLLERLERKLDKAIETKADRADLARLEGRLDSHDVLFAKQGDELKVVQGKLHDGEQHQQHVWSWKQRTYAALGTVAVVAATVLGPYIGTHI